MKGVINGPVVIDRDEAIRGMVAGSIIVRSGGALSLHGMVNGDVTIELGGRAIIHGMVNGAVVNQGGHVEVHGMVDAVRDAPGARTMIAGGALVRQR